MAMKRQHGGDFEPIIVHRRKLHDKKPRRGLRLPSSGREKRASVPFKVMKQPEDLLAEKYKIEPRLRDQFEIALQSFAEDFKLQQARVALPESPVREYRPRESIIDYLRSPEGFGPWVEAKILTRPLLKEKSPKAYTALANWLRNNELPADLPIPTRSESVDQKVSDHPEAMALANTLKSRAYRDGKTSMHPR